MDAWADLFLDTVDDDYRATVASPVDLSECPDRPVEVPSSARVWGATVGKQNKQTFKQMSDGDYVLFYRVGEGEYVGAGQIHTTCTTDWVANHYWGENNAERQLVYFLSGFSEATVPVKEVNEVLGYKNIYHPHGLQRVSDDRVSSEVLSLLDLE
jgi:hypothetical protein